jgi:hypothetical protein
MDEVDFLIMHRKQTLREEEKKNLALKDRYEQIIKAEEAKAQLKSTTDFKLGSSSEGNDENKTPNSKNRPNPDNQNSANFTKQPDSAISKNSKVNNSKKTSKPSLKKSIANSKKSTKK